MIEIKSNLVAINGVVNPCNVVDEKLPIETSAGRIQIETENTANVENQNVDEANDMKCATESIEDIKPDISAQKRSECQTKT